MGLTGLVVGLAIGASVGAAGSRRLLIACLVLVVIGLWEIVDSVGRTITFSDERIELRGVGRRKVSWKLDGSASIRYVKRPISSRWGLSKPDYLVLQGGTDKQAMALVDGQLDKQIAWCGFLEQQIAHGQVHASPEAIDMIKRMGGLN